MGVLVIILMLACNALGAKDSVPNGVSLQSKNVTMGVTDIYDTTANVSISDPVKDRSQEMLLRWLPGGLSIGIFLTYTLAVCIRIGTQKEKVVEKVPSTLDLTDAENFFTTDVIGKLKTSEKQKNIFQRRLLLNKQKKFNVYNGMMRKYKDEIIARREYERRHTELQKEKEEREAAEKAQKEEAIEMLRQKSMRVKAQKSSGDLRHSLRLDSESQGDSSSVASFTSQINDDHINNTYSNYPSENKALTIPSAPMVVVFQPSTEDIPKICLENEGIVIDPGRFLNTLQKEETVPAKDEAKITENELPVTEDTISTDDKNELEKEIVLKIQSQDCLLDMIETQYIVPDDEEGSSRESRHILSDLQTEDLLQSTEGIDEKANKYKKESGKKMKEIAKNKDYSKSFDQDAYFESASIKRSYKRNSKQKSARPSTWFLGETNYEDEQEDLGKVDSMIDMYVQNALESRALCDKNDEKKKRAINRSKKKDRQPRPHTWTDSSQIPKFGPQGKTDSITELFAKFMELGPSHPEGRKQSITFDKNDEDALLDEIERRMIASLHEDNLPIELLESLVDNA